MNKISHEHKTVDEYIKRHYNKAFEELKCYDILLDIQTVFGYDFDSCQHLLEKYFEFELREHQLSFDKWLEMFEPIDDYYQIVFKPRSLGPTTTNYKILKKVEFIKYGNNRIR